MRPGHRHLKEIKWGQLDLFKLLTWTKPGLSVSWLDKTENLGKRNLTNQSEINLLIGYPGGGYPDNI